ncbi:MAG: endonuclease MutS2 [Campylobacteraceae bacterium]|jgi:DNA mismatch repair protein MutS2|nr:endonuclease MutS2 [Campylobacteraceae bacterium]
MHELVLQLDLEDYIAHYKSYLAREKPLYMEGDANLHFRFINELSHYELVPPPAVINLDTKLMHLSKQGVLHIDEIWEFVKIIRYFLYLKSQKFEGYAAEWILGVNIPPAILEIEKWFDNKGNLKEEIDPRFASLNAAIKALKEKIYGVLRSLISSQKLQEFLVDTQAHFLNNQESLLLRGGYASVLKGTIVGRSAGGYFYVVPNALNSYQEQESAITGEKEALMYEYAKKISMEFSKNRLFLSWLNREFDRFDNYLARITFAKANDMEFILPSSDKDIVLKDFFHPALKGAKSVSVNFTKSILLVTGVNAGGKTMLLKSVLAAVLLSKYLLPMKIDAAGSHIGRFKNIKAIIEDTQNVKNDISTFAGRMVEFSRLFTVNSALVGVDEIELGTDADEAAALFCAILDCLIKKEVKIIITTHHKRLASMLASNEQTELLAALYDEKTQRPLYSFLYGTIGKSYAFETAARYGIAQNIVEKARILYGEDKEKLNDLIQKNIDLEFEIRTKLKDIEVKTHKLDKLANSLEEQKEVQKKEFNILKFRFENEYREAVKLAKEAAKQNENKNIHKLLNEADKAKKAVSLPKQAKNDDLNIGDRVGYGTLKGVVTALKKESAVVDIDGVMMYLPKNSLQKLFSPELKTPSKKKSFNISLLRPQNVSVNLDLHGMRSDEAIEKSDKFLSDALLVGFNEVRIYHGVGTGKLAHAVKNFLKTHPSVKEFFDADANQGGAGATIVKL